MYSSVGGKGMLEKSSRPLRGSLGGPRKYMHGTGTRPPRARLSTLYASSSPAFIWPVGPLRQDIPQHGVVLVFINVMDPYMPVNHD
jgi:hypothetical protein